MGKIGVMPMNVVMGDDDYSLPDRVFMNGEFASLFAQYMKQWGLDVFTARRNDCNKMAMNAAIYASNLHARTSRKEKDFGMGVIKYVKADGEGHAVCFYVYEERGTKQVAFWEPQMAMRGMHPEISLTEDEKDSVDAIVVP